MPDDPSGDPHDPQRLLEEDRNRLANENSRLNARLARLEQADEQRLQQAAQRREQRRQQQAEARRAHRDEIQIHGNDAKRHCPAYAVPKDTAAMVYDDAGTPKTRKESKIHKHVMIQQKISRDAFEYGELVGKLLEEWKLAKGIAGIHVPSGVLPPGSKPAAYHYDVEHGILNWKPPHALTVSFLDPNADDETFNNLSTDLLQYAKNHGF